MLPPGHFALVVAMGKELVAPCAGGDSRSRALSELRRPAVSDEIGTYLWKASEGKTLEEVRRYWTENVNTTQFWTGDPRQIGSPEFFDKIGEFVKEKHGYWYRLIDEEAKKYPNGKVLEVGCGAGWESVTWARAGMDVHAIDLSDAALELARQNFEHNNLTGNLQWGNAEDLPYDDNSFDIVASKGGASSYGIYRECSPRSFSCPAAGRRSADLAVLQVLLEDSPCQVREDPLRVCPRGRAYNAAIYEKGDAPVVCAFPERSSLPSLYKSHKVAENRRARTIVQQPVCPDIQSASGFHLREFRPPHCGNRQEVG